MNAECLTVTVEQAAKLLGLSRGSAYALARNGGLPTIRLGRRLLVPTKAIHRMLDAAGLGGLTLSEEPPNVPARNGQ